MTLLLRSGKFPSQYPACREAAPRPGSGLSDQISVITRRRPGHSYADQREHQSPTVTARGSEVLEINAANTRAGRYLNNTCKRI